MKKLLLILLACFAFVGAAFAAQVNLNMATESELDALKGVGPVKAKAIVDYRTKNGPFKSVDDLEKVPGFGKKTVDALRAEVTVGGAVGKAKAKPAADAGKAAGKKDPAGKEEGKKVPDKK
jgi:competence protein ComEA